MTDVIEVHTTINLEEAAQKIAQAIVAKRLGACVQVSGPITSMYWWQEEIDQAHEWLCTVKTTKDLYSDLEQIIRENHTYDTPEILAVSVIAGSKDYLDWVQAETHVNPKGEQETKEQLLQEFRRSLQ